MDQLERNPSKDELDKIGSPNNVIKVSQMSELTAERFVKSCVTHVVEELVPASKKSDTDLTTIRDEILAELNQLLYLFTLH